MDDHYSYFHASLSIVAQVWDELVLTGLLTTEPHIPNTLHDLGEALAGQANYLPGWEEIKRYKNASSVEAAVGKGIALLGNIPLPSSTEMEIILGGGWPDSHILRGSPFELPVRLLTPTGVCSNGMRQKSIKALVVCTHLHARHQQPQLSLMA